MPKLGVHNAKISHVLTTPNKTRKTMLDAIRKDCSELELDAGQIFVSGPQSTKMNPMDYDEIKAYCDDKKINLYVHSNYMSVGIFNVNNDNKETPKAIAAIKNIVSQMEACDKLDSSGFVIHLSKKTPELIVETLKVLYKSIKKFKTMILLEQPAKKPDGELTYETAEKINNLSQLILDTIPQLNWGWCLDTMHLYSGGIELDNYKIVKRWFNDLKYPKYIKLFHLNGGSIKQFNTGKDIHIIPFAPDDDIFSDAVYNDDGEQEFNIKQIKKESIWVIASFAKKYNIDLIMEINRGHFSNIKFAVETLKKII
jgi:endonuclease IV